MEVKKGVRIMADENKHPLEGFMSLTMDNLKQMIEVDTVIGKPIDSPDGSVIIPLSKVKFGFAAGGSEFTGSGDQQTSGSDSKSKDGEEAIIPFGGGSGGGVSITPSAFLIAKKDGVELLSLNESASAYDKLLEKAPQLAEQITEWMKEKREQKKEDENK